MIPMEQDTLYRTFIGSLGFNIVKFMGDRDDFSTFVYKVKEKKETRTIKLAAQGNDVTVTSWEVKHIQNENSILEKTRGIPHLVQKHSYHTGQHDGYTISALVRGYIHGRLLRDFPKVGRKLGSEQQIVLENTVRILHQEGIALLDLRGRNIVVDRTGAPYLIDVGTGLCRNRISSNYFNTRVRRDLKDLEALFERYS